MKTIIYFLLTIPALFFCSCSLNKPSISNLSVKRLAVETENSGLAERLSVFFEFNDKDGVNDYDSFTVVQKDTGLYWKFNRDNTVFFKENSGQENSLKMGTNKIAYPFGKIPLGEYILTARDLAGQESVKSFQISGEFKTPSMPISLTVKNGRWELSVTEGTEYNFITLIFLGADRQPLKIKKIGRAENKLISGLSEELQQEVSNARYIQASAENGERNKGFLTKPVLLLDERPANDIKENPKFKRLEEQVQ